MSRFVCAVNINSARTKIILHERRQIDRASLNALISPLFIRVYFTVHDLLP